MKIVAYSLLTILVATLILPATIVLMTTPAPTPSTPPQVFPQQTSITQPREIKIYDVQTKKTFVMGLDDYLKHVIAGEMPVSFDVEALKAQAVVARTYTLRRLQDQTKRKDHPEADLCTDPAHCQAYRTEDQLKETWGSELSYLINWRRISEAVDSTKDLVITYQGKLIDAVYHSTSGGATENSWEVWPGQDKIPYLVSVPCQWDTKSPRYQETVSIPLATVAEKLQASDPAISVAALAGKNFIQVTEKTTTGRAKTVKVNGKSYRATDFRSLLGINSTLFNYTVTADAVQITTQGFGHAVGLCQYGADGQAKAGKKFDEILKYYYTGVQVEKAN